MTRIVIHAGFHKTGTTTVQTTLQANRALLEPHLRVCLKADFERLTKAARAYSLAPDEAGRAAVGREAARFFRRLDRDDPRPVLMASEDLSGHLPGRRGLTRYHATAEIMALLSETAVARLDAAPVFFFSTRERDAWLRSTWWQNLRSTRLTLDLDRYAEELAGAVDLEAIVAEVAVRVGPAQVASEPLETSRSRREGPLAPLLDLVALPPEPRAALELRPPENVQPDIGLAEVFLALNRSGLDDRHLREAKKTLRRLAIRQADGDRAA
ncbi:MAG: hypothetical protein CML50_01690 [Rhodobacteraceae bacterium]|jgi:hypothetical protein|uniref:Sulfotransferase family protein n=1 Tax=Salipiger profundus TaxID=1229727 RepID=A0A1U7D4Q9_9RHOB|nr:MULTISPECIES: hypothetical protein [Salipiger]APX23055.1 hypothetical protein Ga0080559_TMP2259 [Salipiger profundus]MAB04717.1 hypothetical protein [Paracoccaceae bacterium]GGA13016.1 hypothetical protein GCM10011326_26200 [Salipiger profundus]SFD20306.1 hypothetical protein SAMN05444415_108167 [Salipiger profundus]